MSPNVALLKATLAHIKAHPETWEQSDWSTPTKCGTAYCFAGWAVLLGTGPSGQVDEDDEVPRKALPNEDEIEEHFDDAPASAGYVHVAVAARHLLGLTHDDAEALFGGGNELADLEHMVAELCGESAEAVTS